MYGTGEDFAVDEASPIDRQPVRADQGRRGGDAAGRRPATELRALSLRYFNPIGADPQLRTGLQVKRPTHLLGKLIEAAETGGEFTITGMDWPTRDGTGIRDFIHVWDLATAHIAGLHKFDQVVDRPLRGAQPRHRHRHHGAGDGRRVPAGDQGAPTGPRGGPRPGDVAGAYTRSDRAQRMLDWRPVHSIADGIRDSLRWSEIRDVRLP